MLGLIKNYQILNEFEFLSISSIVFVLENCFFVSKKEREILTPAVIELN
jgi:hypothetical protein